MSGHTPGPWRVTDDAPTIIQCDYRSIGSSGGALIASAMGNDSSGFYVSESESLANARLIAAAPELLEALEQAVTSMQDSGYQNGHPAVRAACAAIAKATGVHA